MKKLITYIKNIIGASIEIHLLQKKELDKLPMYLHKGYNWYKAAVVGRLCILAEMKEDNGFSIAQIEKHFEQVKAALGLPVIGVFKQLEAYNRKRLIEKKVAFVVPEKQLYVPDFFIDLKEFRNNAKETHERLTPTAQLLLLYHILNKEENKQFYKKTFQELAVLLGTNPMGISRAVTNLKHHSLIDITGGKEKFIQFRLKKQELWQEAEQRNLLINPVLKQIYIDEKPRGLLMFRSNEYALPEYSDMNASRQEFYAIDKNTFYGLQKKQALINANENEGRYCLEVWKYNPETLAGELQQKTGAVDPLSLYLSLKDTHNERIEMAMEQIMEQFIW
jgi:hypothetical protein